MEEYVKMEWKWGSTDAGRAGRALKVKVVSVNEGDNPSIECEGSDGAHYYADLEKCTCPDFNINQKKGKSAACKHMVCLAMRLGFLNEHGLTEHDQFLKDFYALEDRLAKYAWYYHVLKDPVVSDAEYDSLKCDYLSKLPSAKA